METERLWCLQCRQRTAHDLGRCTECQKGEDERKLEEAGQMPLWDDPSQQAVS